LNRSARAEFQPFGGRDLGPLFGDRLSLRRALEQEYLRFSQNKAKAQFLLAEREKNTQIEETAA
jgi:hypothetical protein